MDVRLTAQKCKYVQKSAYSRLRTCQNLAGASRGMMLRYAGAYPPKIWKHDSLNDCYVAIFESAPGSATSIMLGRGSFLPGSSQCVCAHTVCVVPYLCVVRACSFLEYSPKTREERTKSSCRRMGLVPVSSICWSCLQLSRGKSIFNIHQDYPTV